MFINPYYENLQIAFITRPVEGTCLSHAIYSSLKPHVSVVCSGLHNILCKHTLVYYRS